VWAIECVLYASSVITANRRRGVRWNLRSWHTISAGLIQEVGCERECVEYRCGRPAWTCPDLEKTLNNSREKERGSSWQEDDAWLPHVANTPGISRKSILCSCTFKNFCCWIFYFWLLIIYLQACFCVGMWLSPKVNMILPRVWTCAECIIYVRTAASFSLINRRIIQSLDSAEEQIPVKAFFCCGLESFSLLVVSQHCFLPCIANS